MPKRKGKRVSGEYDDPRLRQKRETRKRPGALPKKKKKR